MTTMGIRYQCDGCGKFVTATSERLPDGWIHCRVAGVGSYHYCSLTCIAARVLAKVNG